MLLFNIYFSTVLLLFIIKIIKNIPIPSISVIKPGSTANNPTPNNNICSILFNLPINIPSNAQAILN
ncbi:MAG: hypothetical protein QMB54_00965, partial [Neofamilia sp.]